MNGGGRFLIMGLLSSAAIFVQQGCSVTPTEETEQAQYQSKMDLKPEGIRDVQAALNKEGYAAGPVDGIWGASSDRALRDFQYAKGLEANGRMNEETALALGFSREELSGVVESHKLAKSDVTQVQEALNKSGYDVGAVDGVWGPSTESALRDFQQAKGLEASGKLNRDTVAGLGLSTSEFAAGEFKEETPKDTSAK